MTSCELLLKAKTFAASCSFQCCNRVVVFSLHIPIMWLLCPQPLRCLFLPPAFCQLAYRALSTAEKKSRIPHFFFQVLWVYVVVQWPLKRHITRKKLSPAFSSGPICSTTKFNIKALSLWLHEKVFFFLSKWTRSMICAFGCLLISLPLAAAI